MLVESLLQASTKPTQPSSGLHILSNIESVRTDRTLQFEPFKRFVCQAVRQIQLNQVGEAWHNFDGGGFTGVLCLAESHLSIHTWPHNHYLTFDIYLSNHSTDNSGKARLLYKQVLEFFEASAIQENYIQR